MCTVLHKWSLKQTDSMGDKLPTDRTVVDLLSAIPAELVAAEEGCVSGFRQANHTVRTFTYARADSGHLHSYKETKHNKQN